MGRRFLRTVAGAAHVGVHGRIRPGRRAEDQAAALPAEALTAYLELRSLLEVSPWSGVSANPQNPKANMLNLSFGRFGLVTYVVLEELRVVYVVSVLWAG